MFFHYTHFHRAHSNNYTYIHPERIVKYFSTCIVFATHLVFIFFPLLEIAAIDDAVRPLIVKLDGENRPLSADHSYQLHCNVIGSRPAPTITWWKGSTPMKNTHEVVSSEFSWNVYLVA